MKVKATIKNDQNQSCSKFALNRQTAILKEIEDHRARIEALKHEFTSNQQTLLNWGVSIEDQKRVYDRLDYGRRALKEFEYRPINGYKVEWSWWEKTRYILAKAGQPLTSKDIIARIYDFEPEYNQAPNIERRKLGINIWTTLRYKVKRNEIVKLQDKYSLRQWTVDNDKNKIEKDMV